MDGTIQARKPFFALLVLCAIAGPASAVAAERPTALDRSESIGFYSDGFLLNPVGLPDESFAHLKIFRRRDRGWGTRPLVDAILSASRNLRFRFPEGDRVSIGDLSSEEGGRLSRHSSHQNGLDADIAYLRVNRLERNPDEWGEAGFAESFVRKGKLTANFDRARNWHFLKELVARGNVQRIFVDPAIKRFYCRSSREIDRAAPEAVRAETLRRLRPYPDHADHLHMRVTCPEDDPRCIPQEEVPPGSGCDSIDSLAIDEHEL